MDFGCEAISQIAGGGKPARGIEQVGDGLLDGGEFQAFDRTVFVPGDGAFVFEGPMGGLAGDERSGWRDADGSVGGTFAGEHFSGRIGDLIDLQSGMETEADHL